MSKKFSSRESSGCSGFVMYDMDFEGMSEWLECRGGNFGFPMPSI